MNKFKRFNLKNDHCYFVTSTTIDKKPIFAKEEAAQILLNCLYNFRKQERYLLLCFVIMPTHLHILIVPDEKYNISQIMHSIKRSSSRLLTKLKIKTGRIWMPSFFEHTIRNKKDFYEKANYIHNNPVKAGLANKSEDYLFSSANKNNETDFNKYWI